MPRFIGLDLHKRVLEVCIVGETGSVVQRDRIPVSAQSLRAYAEQELQPDDRVAVEATTNTWC